MRRWVRVAHRGASAHAPENTLAAFRRALEIGTDMIELDVHLSADGEIVVIHDATLDRTTDRTGAIARTAYSEIRRADAGVRFGDEFSGERVPTLRDALELIPTDVLVAVEIKAMAATIPVADLVREMDRLDQILAISFDPRALRTLRDHESRIPTGLLLGVPLIERDARSNAIVMLRAAQSVGTSTVSIASDLVSSETVWEIQRRGGAVWTWTVNEVDAMRRVLDAGVQAITSDYPDRLNEIG